MKEMDIILLVYLIGSLVASHMILYLMRRDNDKHQIVTFVIWTLSSWVSVILAIFLESVILLYKKYQR